ncbi:MAG: hypothetical protein E7450_07410 [Ruminococcaceae bacterium]|nr:hypothetical protein [Oscillospiraceae bacterium]
MISCTEFVPLYSEFFRFLEEREGFDAVMRYWLFISGRNVGNRANPYSLSSFLERYKDNPLEGAWKYWCRALSEEASDVIRVYNPKENYIFGRMRHCPSRGRLNALEHIEPYHAYCEHCGVVYAPTLKEFGLVMERDHSKVDRAECRSLLYVEGHRPDLDFDYTTITDEEMRKLAAETGSELLDMTAGDNKYLHRAFHNSSDTALRFCGENYGDEAVREFVDAFTRRYYAPQIKDAKARGLVAIKEWLEAVYAAEETSEVLHTDLSDTELTVAIDYCPGMGYMRSVNREPCQWYIEETRTLYAAFAETAGLDFKLDYFEDDGKTRFHFIKK